MIVIIADILSEPLLSPQGKPCPEWPIYTLTEWETLEWRQAEKKENCLKFSDIKCLNMSIWHVQSLDCVLVPVVLGCLCVWPPHSLTWTLLLLTVPFNYVSTQPDPNSLSFVAFRSSFVYKIYIPMLPNPGPVVGRISELNVQNGFSLLFQTELVTVGGFSSVSLQPSLTLWHPGRVFRGIAERKRRKREQEAATMMERYRVLSVPFTARHTHHLSYVCEKLLRLVCSAVVRCYFSATSTIPQSKYSVIISPMLIGFLI